MSDDWIPCAVCGIAPQEIHIRNHKVMCLDCYRESELSVADPSVVDALNTLRKARPYIPTDDFDAAFAVVEAALADERERSRMLLGQCEHLAGQRDDERARAVAAEAALGEARDEAYAMEVIAARFEADRNTLRALVVEHHALGAMNSIEWGGQCPVCAKNPRARAVLAGEEPT